MANEKEQHFCPFCEGFVEHTKMANGDWCCSHCGKTWKEGAEYRRISEKMRKTEPLKKR